MADKSDSDISSQFLITEYQSLQDRAKSYEEIKSNRINFFLLVVAFAWAIITTLTGNKITDNFIAEAILLIGGFVLLIGLFVLKSLVDYSILIVICYRRAGRMRRWFVDNDPKLERYIAFPAVDDQPKFLVSKSEIHLRGGEPILLVINSVCISLISGIALFKILPNMDWLNLLLSIGLGGLLICLQFYYVRSRLKKTQKVDWVRRAINFPRPDTTTPMDSTLRES